MRAVLIVLLSICSSCFAVEIDGTWQQVQLNETFMRSLTKDQCMQKTIASLNFICTNDNCIKTMGGVVGDCVTWAKGEMNSFCAKYDESYNSVFCSAETFDSRRCEFIRVGKRAFCRR